MINILIITFVMSGLKGNTRYDFGVREDDTVISHRFTLVNDSNDTIVIYKLNTSCSCTAGEITKRTLAPQETTFVSIQFNPHGYTGRVSKYAYVFYMRLPSKNRNELTLSMKGKIKNNFLRPYQIMEYTDNLIVDIRKRKEFERLHLVNAINFSPKNFISYIRKAQLELPVNCQILIISNENDTMAMYLLNKLKREFKFNNVHILRGGMDAYIKSMGNIMILRK